MHPHRVQLLFLPWPIYQSDELQFVFLGAASECHPEGNKANCCERKPSCEQKLSPKVTLEKLLEQIFTMPFLNDKTKR